MPSCAVKCCPRSNDEQGQTQPPALAEPGKPLYDRQLNAYVEREIARENGTDRLLLEDFIGDINFTRGEYRREVKRSGISSRIYAKHGIPNKTSARRQRQARRKGVRRGVKKATR